MRRREMSDNGPTGNPVPDRPASGREILRVGLGNYASNRWLPKNPVLKFVIEIAILVVFFLVLAILMKLTQG